MISELHTPDPVESSKHLALVHPALARLEEAMIDQENRVNVATEANTKGRKALDALDSTRWASDIERAVNNPGDLAAIRQQYNRSALAFMNMWLIWVNARKEMMAGRSVINDVIIDTFVTFNALPSAGLGPIFRARLTAAAEMHGRNVTEKVIPHHSAHKNRVEVPWLEPSRTVVELADQIQANAFKVLLGGLAANTRHDVYTTAFAVPDTTRANTANPNGFETRYLEPVAFTDNADGKNTGSAQLFELLLLLKGALSRCSQSDNNLTHQQKGTINERQHSDRVVAFLHSEAGLGESPQQVAHLQGLIEDQDVRRYDFEIMRQQLALDVAYLRSLLESIVSALKTAVPEAGVVLCRVEEQKTTTIDEQEMLRIMLNNCLAADVLLRRAVATLLSYERKVKDDISIGAGDRATRNLFKEAAARYAHQVEQRTQKLGTIVDTTA